MEVSAFRNFLFLNDTMCIILPGMMYCIDRQSLLSFPPLPATLLALSCYISSFFLATNHCVIVFLQRLVVNSIMAMQWNRYFKSWQLHKGPYFYYVNIFFTIFEPINPHYKQNWAKDRLFM